MKSTDENEIYAEHTKLREAVILAIFLDTKNQSNIVMKGASAIDLVHGSGRGRSSVDIDISIREDFDMSSSALKEDAFKSALKRNIIRTMLELGYYPFEFNLKANPNDKSKQTARGGYEYKFYVTKVELIKKKHPDIDWDDIQDEDLEKISRISRQIMPDGKGKFKIDISKYDVWSDDIIEEKDFKDISVPVYSLLAIVCEKLRAICQKLKKGMGRPKDFYDIYWIVKSVDFDVEWGDDVFIANLAQCFKQKNVCLNDIFKIKDSKSIQEQGWPALRDTLRESEEDSDDFDNYFDFLVQKIKEIEPQIEEISLGT